MSHYTCLVIGEDVDGQLAPYDENEPVEPYKSYWDSDEITRWEGILRESTTRKRDPETKEEHEEECPPEQVLTQGEYSLEDMRRVYMARYHSYEEPDREFVEGLEGFEVDESELDERLHIDDGGIYEWSTYNPKSKWDWYQIGGRWTGYFKLKKHALAGATLGESGTFDNEPEHDADQARKGDVDIEWMRDDAGRRAAERWDRVNAVIGDLPAVLGWEDHYVGRLKLTDAGEDSITIEQARSEYHAQPAVVALKEWNESLPDEEKVLGWFGPDVESFQIPRDEYIAEARDDAICPYAYLMGGEWHAPGKMGWFGSSTDTRKERRQFAREFNEFLDSLPDDTLLTLCDLHI